MKLTIKRTVMLFLISQTFLANAQSGMLNGSGYAPNISVTDINSIPHNLYDYLDSGKVVVLELMSTTCGHCQQYAAGTENSYQAYGPNGLDVAEFIGLEVNSLTSDNDLANFATAYGVSFPLCNNISPAAINYQLYYTPGYYVVYPDSSYVTFCPAYCQTTSSYSTIENLLNTAIQAWLPLVYGCTDSLATNYDSNANYDDGSCTYSGACDAITGASLTDVIHDRVQFNWDDMNYSSCVVDQIRIRYSDDGGSTYVYKTMGAPVGNNAPCLNASKLVLNLTASTQYEYDFKIWYQDGTVRDWHANGTFTTDDVCINATNMIATPNSTTQATFCWDAPISPWAFVRLQYRENIPGSSFSNIGGFGVMAPALCKTKNGLVAGTDYRVMWRTWCSIAGGPYRSPVWDGPLVWAQPSVRMEGGTAINNLDVYPIPSRDIFNVSFTSEDVQDLKVRVLNLVGEELVNEALEQFIGEYTKQIDLSGNTKGIYLLEIETNDAVVNTKLILQ